jgi:NAD(P)-dependent dehydrogenase (short-subunit alcohol dehydrogenase family)
MGNFHGQRICIIGATAGIGHAIAARAAAAGAEVILTGRNAIRAEDTARGLGGKASGHALEITDAAAIAAFFSALGPVDHLVTTAATVRPGPFRGGDPAAAKMTFEGKFWSQYLCARHADVGRSILLFSGAFSRRPRPGVSSIAAVNGAVEALGRALAVELAPVRVNVMSPGLVRGTAAYSGMPDAARDAMFADAAARLPARLVGGPDSVAVVALSLLESDYATGTVIDVDGGGLLV